ERTYMSWSGIEASRKARACAFCRIGAFRGTRAISVTRTAGMPARAGRLGSRSVTYRSASKADARVSTTRSPPPMKLMWSWRTAIRMGRRMRLPAINARGLARWRAAPPDPVESRVPVVEDLNERRRVELRDHRRIHRGGGFPRREPHARFHVPINPHIGPVFHPGRRRDVREACKRRVREFRQERVPCSVPGRVDPPESEDRRRPLVVRHDESAHMVPRPVRRVHGGRGRPLSPACERRRGRDAGDRVGGEEDATHPEGEGPFPTAKAREVQEAEEPDSRKDRKGDHQVFRVSIRNQYARGHGDSHYCGAEEGDEPTIHLKAVGEEIDESATRCRERQQEDERDEVEEPGRGHPKRRPRDPDDDRAHSEYEE